MHQLRLLHTVLLSKMPPHNSPFPSSFNGASSLKHNRVARILFSNQGTSAPSTVSAVLGSNSSPTSVPHVQRDVPLPPCLSRPADQPGHTPPLGLDEQILLCVALTIPPKQRPARPPQAHGLSSLSPGFQPSSQLPPARQRHVSTTQVGQHPTLSIASQKRNASTAFAGIQPAISAEARAGRGPFPKPMPTILPVVRFGQPEHGTLHNAVSGLTTSTASLCFSGTQALHAGTTPRWLRRRVAGFTRSSFKKPLIMCPESRTSSSRTRVTQTLPSCSTRQLLCFEDFYDALPFPAPPRSLFAPSTSTMLWPRNAMPPLSFFSGFTGT